MADDIDKLLENYQPTETTQELVRQTKTVLLVGISGAGKSTIRHHLLALGNYYHIISHTTRLPRSNNGILEQNGREYHFIDIAKAADMLKNHEFVEAKRYGKNIYGTTAREFELANAKHKIAITDVEVQGVSEYMKFAAENTYPIFLLPPSYEIWHERWQQRYGSEGDNLELIGRMKTAISEIEHVLETDYFSIVVNDNLDQAVKAVNEIAKNGQHNEASRQAGLLTAKQILADMKQQISTR